MPNAARPKIVSLVGSCRFFRDFIRAAYDNELAGVITVGPAFAPDVPPDGPTDSRRSLTPRYFRERHCDLSEK